MNRVKEANLNLADLDRTRYPGSGIVLGREKRSGDLVQITWIMVEGGGDRDRIFVERGDGTVSIQPGNPKMPDPDILVYNAMRERGDCYLVGNGTQIDDLAEEDGSFHEILGNFEYHPNPNFTPRISGIQGSDDGVTQLSFIRKGMGKRCERLSYTYEEVKRGFGYCITTYMEDGDPPPSWRGGPMVVPIVGGIKKVADTYWGCLHIDNRTSLVVKFIPFPGDGSTKSQIRIINQYGKVKRVKY